MKLLHNIFLSLVLLSSAAFSVSAMAAPDTAADKVVKTSTETLSESALVSGSRSESQKVNINTANAQQIAASMKGIGESKARAIIEYRDAHGKFTSLEELQKVAGIGAKTIEKNKTNLTL